MSFANKSIALATIGLLLSATAVFAQVGGGDVPTDAKKQGTKENGSSSTGMSQGEAHSSDKGSMSGGQAGGSSNKQ